MTSKIPSRGLTAAALALLTTATLTAHGTGSLSSGSHTPLEQRVALSIGPSRTTLWTQLRVSTQAGPFAIVLPAADGASLDWTDDAWFEALDMATAPRVQPPSGAVAACPGESPPADPIHLVGNPLHVDPIAAVEVVVLDDADAVASWALSNSMMVTVALYDSMVTLGATRFVAARFDAPNADVVTPALRVSGPAISSVLPLVLSHADASSDLLVTSWTIAQGRAALDGPAASLDDAQLSYDAANATTNYIGVRSSALTNLAHRDQQPHCTGRFPGHRHDQPRRRQSHHHVLHPRGHLLRQLIRRGDVYRHRRQRHQHATAGGRELPTRRPGRGQRQRELYRNGGSQHSGSSGPAVRHQRR